jgi:hypothetical protein
MKWLIEARNDQTTEWTVVGCYKTEEKRNEAFIIIAYSTRFDSLQFRKSHYEIVEDK